MSALGDRLTHDILKLIDSGALEGSFADFVRLSGKSLEHERSDITSGVEIAWSRESGLSQPSFSPPQDGRPP